MTSFAAALASERPTEVALRDGHQALGWGEVDDVLNRAANGLLALDLGERRRVAVFGENSVETALANLGGLLGSCSVVPVNFHLTADEVAYILEDSDCRIVFCGPETVDRAVEAAAKAGDPRVIGWRVGDRDGVEAFDEWLASSAGEDPPTDVPPRPNFLYTSGTTGLPKGTELPPTMFAAGKDIAEHLDALRRNPFATFGTHLVVGPMYHTGPLSGARLLAAGVPSVVLERFDAEATLKAIDEYRTETSVMVPTHFNRLLALPEQVRARYDVSSMKFVGHTGAKCPVDVKRAMIEWWGPVFFDAYGATEVGTVATIFSEEWLEHPGSVGRAVPPFSATILGDDDEPVPARTEGRLFFEDATGRGVIYPNDPEKTAKANLRPGLFTLGEIGYMDEDGYIFLTDRDSDMVVSGGVNIYPAEAEGVLIEHPEVADIACIGIPHQDMGEQLHALVIPEHPESPPDPGDLLAWCRERLSTYKCPRSVEFVDDVGRNTMGKVNKRRLRAPYWQEQTP
jgi:long-chain acyl-CoA synthetase